METKRLQQRFALDRTRGVEHLRKGLIGAGDTSLGVEKENPFTDAVQQRLLAVADFKAGTLLLRAGFVVFALQTRELLLTAPEASAPGQMQRDEGRYCDEE